MFTFGYRWRPWTEDRALADGPSILDYLRTVAREYGVDRLIRYRHRVVARELGLRRPRAGRSRSTATASASQLTASFLWGCSGYYDTEQGYAPEFPGQDDFAGAGRASRSTGPRTSTTRARGSS